MQNNKNISTQDRIPVELVPDTTLDNQENLNPDNSPVQDAKGFTKSGLPRKRRVYDVPLNERNYLKKQLNIEKLSLKNACNENCRQKCTSKFTEDQRKIINDSYAKLSKECQGVFIKGMVEMRKVSNRKQTSKETPKRKVTYCYFLDNEDQTRIEVCKTFF